MKVKVKVNADLALVMVVMMSVALPPAFGYVSIQPKGDSINCLTVMGSSDSNGAYLVLASCQTPRTNYQQFQSSVVGSVSRFTTGTTIDCDFKCLDVVGGTGNGVPVTQQDCNPGKLAQLWAKANAPMGAQANFFWYQNFFTGRCMTAEGVGGTYVDQWYCTYLALHQLWKLGTFDPAFGGATVINQAYQTNCLGVVGGNPRSNATVNTQLCTSGAGGAAYQRFNVQESNYFMWQVRGSDAIPTKKCMDGGFTPESTYQYTCTTGARNQQWLSGTFPNEGPVDYVYFVEMASSLCLTYDSVSVFTEACVQGNTRQQWVQLPVP